MSKKRTDNHRTGKWKKYIENFLWTESRTAMVSSQGTIYRGSYILIANRTYVAWKYVNGLRSLQLHWQFIHLPEWMEGISLIKEPGKGNLITEAAIHLQFWNFKGKLLFSQKWFVINFVSIIRGSCQNSNPIAYPFNLIQSNWYFKAMISSKVAG